MALANRMAKELRTLRKSPPEGVCAWPEPADSTTRLSAQLQGPPGTVYEAGVFRLSVHVPERYPFEPPKVAFLTRVFHPNIDASGRVCLDVLDLPPKGSWRPSLNLVTVLAAVRQLLAEPNASDPLDADATDAYVRDRPRFDATARRMVAEHASGAAAVAGAAAAGAAGAVAGAAGVAGADDASASASVAAAGGASAAGGAGCAGGAAAAASAAAGAAAATTAAGVSAAATAGVEEEQAGLLPDAAGGADDGADGAVGPAAPDIVNPSAAGSVGREEHEAADENAPVRHATKASTKTTPTATADDAADTNKAATAEGPPLKVARLQQ